MNKTEFIAKMAEGNDISKRQAGEELTRVLETIESAVQEAESGSSVNLTGYMKFNVKDVEAREGRNPSTGEAIQLEATRQVRVSAGSKLKEAVKA